MSWGWGVQGNERGKRRGRGSASVLNLDLIRSYQYKPELTRLAAENATRVPCRHCGVPILPANLARHEGYHEED